MSIIETLPKQPDKLPAPHQALVDQERGRIGRVMSALVIDQELGDDLGLIVLADIESDLGKAFASALWDVREVVDEIRNAAVQNRRPVVVEAIWGHVALECVRELVRDGMEHIENRRPGSLMLLVVDRDGNVAATMVLPVIRDLNSGVN